MQIAFQRHWLEDAIGTERDPVTLAQAIAARPEFHDILRQSVEFARQNPTDDDTRVIAEHVAGLLQGGFHGFTTMH